MDSLETNREALCEAIRLMNATQQRFDTAKVKAPREIHQRLTKAHSDLNRVAHNVRGAIAEMDEAA